jgi:hypothetical protein
MPEENQVGILGLSDENKITSLASENQTDHFPEANISLTRSKQRQTSDVEDSMR